MGLRRSKSADAIRLLGVPIQFSPWLPGSDSCASFGSTVMVIRLDAVA